MSLGVSPALDPTTNVIGPSFGPYQFIGQDRTLPSVTPNYALLAQYSGADGYYPYSSPEVTIGPYNSSTNKTAVTIGTVTGPTALALIGIVYTPSFLYSTGYSISVTIPTVLNGGSFYTQTFAGRNYLTIVFNGSDIGVYTLSFATSKIARTVRFQATSVTTFNIYETLTPGPILLATGARSAVSPYTITFTQNNDGEGQVFTFDEYLRIGQLITITGAPSGAYNYAWNGTYVISGVNYNFFECSAYTGTTPPPPGSTTTFDNITKPVFFTPVPYETTYLTGGPLLEGDNDAQLVTFLPVPLPGPAYSGWSFTLTGYTMVYPQVGNTVSLDSASAFFLPYAAGNGTNTLVIGGTLTSLPTTPVLLRVNSYDALTNEYISNIQSYFTFSGTITVTPAISNNVIQLYLYEPFNYRFSFLTTGGTSTSTTLAGTSADMLLYMTRDVSGVTFAKATGYTGITNSFGYPIAIQDSLGNSCNATVYIRPGRFYTPTTTSYSFYRNEAITPIQFNSVANLSAYYVSPTLPVGFTFTSVNGSSNQFLFQGISPTTVSRTSYMFIGSNTGGQIVTTTISFQVLPERLSLTAGPLTQTLTVETPLATPTVFRSTVPTSAIGTMRYSWSSLPSGLRFQDVSGNAVTAPFYPTDSNLSLYIAGTPTNLSSVALAGTGSNIFPTVVNASAYGANGTLANTATVNFTYSETVMFSNATGLISSLTVPLTAGLAVPSGNSVTATTYYATSSIVSIYSPDLRSDLSLNVVGSTATLVGTPLSTGTNNYTIRAVNGNGVIGEIQMTIPVAPDIVTLSGPVDACMNFVVGRPVSSGLPGYYTANPRLTGTSSAGLPVTITAPELAATGITFTNGAFGGIPSTVTPLTSMVFTANDSLVSTSKTVPIAVVDDVFTWNSVTLQFAQNRVRTPLQFSVTTLSGLPVISYSASGQPDGITMTAEGVLRGACTSTASGTMVVSASTGFTTKTQNYPYTVAPDVMLMYSDQNEYPLPGTAQVNAVAYSGSPITNFTLTSNPYGISVSSTGLIDGALISGIPPAAPALPRTYTMLLRAYASNAYTDQTVTILTQNPYINYAFIPFGLNLYGYDTVARTFDLLYTSLAQIVETKTNNGTTLLATVNSRLQRTTNRTFLPVSMTDVGILAGGGFPGALTVAYANNIWYVFYYFQSNEDPAYTGFWQQLSTDDGQTFPVNLSFQHNGLYPQYGTYNYVSANKDNVIIVAGSSYSNDGNVSNGVFYLPLIDTFVGSGGTTLMEVRAIDLNGSVFVAAGSDTYYLGQGNYSADGTSLHYSTDNGLNWTAGTGDFNFMGMNVLHNNGIWLATGIDASGGQYRYSVRTSTDGQAWTYVTLPPEYAPAFAAGPDPAVKLGPIMYDDAWNILYTTPATQVILRSTDRVTWSIVTPTTPASGTLTMSTFGPPYWTTGTAAPSSTLVLGTNGVGAGPVISTPTTNGFQLMQFVTITPIVITSPETIYTFVETASLPRGITFDPLTNTFSGTPVLTGSTTVIVRVKNATGGITTFPLYFVVQIPDVQNKHQTSAAAFTSLVRQEVAIDGAQYARDTLANPVQAVGVGALMSPAPPTVTTSTIPQNCTKTC